MALRGVKTTCGEDKYWDCDIDKDWVFGWRGNQRSLGSNDPLFASSALYKKLWEWGYCKIYAISYLARLDTAYDPDVTQIILIVANPFQMDKKNHYESGSSILIMAS